MTTEWVTLVLGILSPISALAGVFVTLRFQERRERTGTGVSIAVELLDSVTSFLHVIHEAAKRRAKAQGPASLAASEHFKLLMADAKVAGNRWSTARAQADFAFPRKDVRQKITDVSDAVGVYEEEFTKITSTGDPATLTEGPYAAARSEAYRHVDELRDRLLAMKL